MPKTKEVEVRYTDEGKVVFDLLREDDADNNNLFKETVVDISAHESADDILRFARPAKEKEDESFADICTNLLMGGRIL